ncbi:MAG: carbamoyltransferase C-terminal domain-containing protein [Rhizobiaceae bacterium]
MKILGLKPGHDGAIAVLDGDELLYSIEAEKNSFPRYSPITPSSLLDVAMNCKDLPDCIAIGGWPKGFYSDDLSSGTGYWGVGEDYQSLREISFFGSAIQLFEGTHESSHLWGAYGMSPYADKFPCHVLVWEGNIGRFYRIDEGGKITRYPQILDDPGNKYAFIFSLADPGYDENSTNFRFEDAGKLMALAAFSDRIEPNAEEARLIDWVLRHEKIAGTRAKAQLRGSRYYNVGVESPAFKALARVHSEAIFGRFLDWARANLEHGLPLVIGGGCGLNCSWNTAWLESGVFSDVFVPPCANDSGSAIGTAIEAKFRLTQSAHIDWNVYCGSILRHHEVDSCSHIQASRPLQIDDVVSDLLEGHVVAVMKGPCEIGPRALGNRSLLADPRDATMHSRLNDIKKRENYRPIAPVCTKEDSGRFFASPIIDKYMLFFSKVTSNQIPAVTHVDGSARVQIVAPKDNEFLWSILTRFGAQTGVPILCNTSLNFNGKGFIDSVDDLVGFCLARGIHRAVCDDLYLNL